MIKPFFKNKCGSALLITLLVLSLLLVMVMGFVAFIRMQIREATHHHDRLMARANAWLGMELALSQLQLHAGADQRVTSPATTVYPLKDFHELFNGSESEGNSEMFSLYRQNAQTSSARSYLNHVGTYTTPRERENWDAALANWWRQSQGHPHWVGVFNSSLRVDRSTDPMNPRALPAQVYEENPNTLFSEPDRSQLPVWLVSGNERLGFDPRRDTGYPVGYLTPVTPLPDPDAPNSTSVWVVGAGSAAPADTSVDGLDGRVKVTALQMENGRYAFWVGDESLKANFAVREPEELVNAPPGSVAYRNRLQVPQRVGWERINGFREVFDSNPGMDVNDPGFEKVVSQSQIGLVHPDFSEPVRSNFHHVTSTSQTLLTDPALGGLKKDLTRYLDNGAGLNDNDPIADPARYSVDDSRFKTWGGTTTGFPNNSAAALAGIPTFGQLRSWYQNAAPVSSSAM